MKTLVYLATPYSHDDPRVRLRRFEEVNKVAAELMCKGIHIYSPISHTHPIALAGDLPLDWEFWQKYDEALLKACCKVIVLKQEGWSLSTGVRAEIAIAQKMGIPVEFMEHENV